MSFLSGLTSIFGAASEVAQVAQGASLAIGAAGTVASLVGSFQTADALEQQASQLQGLSQSESRAIREIAETEARLIEEEALDEAAVLEFNIGVAQRNAEWERRAGEIAISQARTKWENQVKSVVARFAASGTRLEGTTNDVIAEQIGEMEKDLFTLELNTQRAVGQEQEQARLFSLQKAQIQRRGSVRSAARRRVGEIEAGTAILLGDARASAAETEAGTARISGFGNALRGGGSLLGDVADFLN